MAVGDTTVTVIGNLTANPELVFTPRGDSVVNFTVASTPRYFDRAAGEWRDGDALFMRCSLWRQAAENLAESLTRGARVIAAGRLKQRSFTTREGDKRTVVELEADEIGPSLRYATATVTRTSSGSGRTRSQRTTPDIGRGFDHPDAGDTGVNQSSVPVVEEDPWEVPAMAGAATGSAAAPPF